MPNTAYGKACKQCATAKAKCTLRGPDLSCERCGRLKKACQPATGVRRKPGPKRKGGNTGPRSDAADSPRVSMRSRTDQLEKRLDELAQLLGTVPGVSRQPAGSPPRSQNERIQNSGGLCIVTADQHATSSIPALPPVAAAAANEPAVDGVLGPDLEMSWHEAEAALDTFRNERLKAFPFVHIPASTTARELGQSSPMLWLSIKACCASSAVLQQALGKRFRSLLAEQVVVQHQRSLDHVLGLLGYMGWSKCYMGGESFMLMYSHILVAMVQDLGLDQPHMSRFAPPRGPLVPVPPPPAGPGSGASAATGTDSHPLDCLRSQGFRLRIPSEFRPEQSMEVKRALLASYLVTGLVSQLHHKPSPLSWVENLEECLYFLDATPETPLDRVLAHQVRLQRIVGDIPPPAVHSSAQTSEKERLLQEFQIQALLARLREVERMQPTNIPQNLSLACQRATIHAEAAICAVALGPLGTVKSAPGPKETEAHDNKWQIDMLARCLYLTKNWYREVFLMPIPQFFYSLSFQHVVQLSFFCIMMYRLVRENSFGWDYLMARQHLDVGGILDTLGSRFDESPLAAKFSRNPDGSDLFSCAPRAIRIMKSAWLGSWQERETGARGVQEVDETNFGDGDGFSLGMTEEVGAWFADIFAPGWDASP